MELGNQFGLGIILAYGLEYLKRSRWFPFLSDAHSERYKIIIGGLAAFVTTVGIHYTFDVDHETGRSVFSLMLPSIPEAFHGLMDFAKQWAFQQASYDGFVAKKP